ncbi:MAG: copper homeostasis protein CutC [Planctomycetota bacterium]
MSATPVLVEIAVESGDGALAAQHGGADRVELCAALELGGLTPSVGCVAETLAATNLPVFPIVRVRPGDFVLSRRDVREMVRDIRAFVAEGVAGVVCGAVTPDGLVDRSAMAELIDAAATLPVTFHRAFDQVRDPIEGIEDLVELGVARVLSSGGEVDAEIGATNLGRWVQAAAGRLVMIAGGGVRARNVAGIVRTAGVREVHLSAAGTVDGPMRSRTARVDFAVPPRAAWSRRVTLESEVRATLAALTAQ